jgi:hypothetical protein
MQPLKLLCPLLLTVFHVMKRGCRSRFGEDRDDCELVELAGVAVPEALLLLEVELLAEGRLLLELELLSRFRRREMAAGRRVGGASSVSISVISESSSSGAEAVAA